MLGGGNRVCGRRPSSRWQRQSVLCRARLRPWESEKALTPGSTPEAGVLGPTARYLELELVGGGLKGGG